MVRVLVFTGLIFVGMAIWLGRIQSRWQQKELQELKHVRKELLEAKKEVGSLLEQLEIVSQKVVDEISATIKEAKLLENQLSRQTVNNVSGADNATGAGNVPGAGPEGNVTSPEDDNLEEHQRYKKSAQKQTGPVNKTIIFPRQVTRQKEQYGKDHNTATDQSYSFKEIPPKHQMVYAMDKLGYSEEEIAQQMKIGKGEVRLMLQLKRKGEEANV